MPWLLALVNTIGGAGSAASAVAAVVRPPLLAPRDGTNRDDRFYPAMYAARSVPLGLMVAVVVWLARYLGGGRREESCGWASGGRHDVLPLSIE